MIALTLLGKAARRIFSARNIGGGHGHEQDRTVGALGQRVSLMVQAGSTSKVVLQFLPDWLQSQNGTILRGGTVAVKFAPEHLSACRNSMRGGGTPLHRRHPASARACRRCDHMNASSASCRGPETGGCAS